MLSKEETTKSLEIAMCFPLYPPSVSYFNTDALATVADSAEFLIELIKVIARCFFQVSHPGSCRIYVLFQLERKMYLTQECELKLASRRLVTSALLKLVTIFFFPRLTARFALSTHHISVVLRYYLS